MTRDEASKAIGQILAQLEVDQQVFVDSIAVYDVEVTNIKDTQRRIKRAVRIEVKPRGEWA